MWIGQWFGRDALCERQYTINVDQATVWPGVLYKGHYVADITVCLKHILRVRACG